MVPIELIILILALVGNGFIALFTFSKNPNSYTNRLLFLFTITIATYNIFNYLISHQVTNDATFFWIKMVMSVATIINVLFYMLVTTFPQSKFTVKKPVLFVSILFTLSLIILAQYNFIFEGITRKGSNIDSVPGAGMPLFLLHTVIYLGGSFIILIRKLRKSSGLIKAQIKIFLLSTISLFVSILITNLIFPVVFKFTALISLLPVYTVVFNAFISYAIVRHRLLNINLLVARSVAYLLLISILGLLYASSIFLVSNYFYASRIELDQAFVFVLLALFIAFTLQPLRLILEELTDHLFFKGKYSSDELVFRLTKIMASTLLLEDLLKNVLKELLATMRVVRGSFIIFRENESMLIVSSDYEKQPVYDAATIGRLFGLKRIIIFEEEDDEIIKQIMQSLNIAVALPLYEDGHHEGMLVLEEKKSGEIYSKQDINVLNILGPEVSVAINNAEAYEKISKFNVTLRNEIDIATKDLQNANEKLKVLDKLKDEFVYTASHELRTPMTAIKSYLWMTLQGDVGTLNDTQKLYLERAYSSTDRLIKLVSDMLNISRIESGRITVDMNRVDLVKTTQEVIDDVQPRAFEMGVSVAILPSPPLPDVFADADKIKEVLFNLIGNSIKFTPRGGRITVSFVEKNGYVETNILDTGAGISAENISKLFQKFSMLPESYVVNKNASGTGLGLYISRCIIEMHQGKIWVTSEGEGKGSQFSFSLKTYTANNLNITNIVNSDNPTEKLATVPQ